jgi:hypothetical protein
MDRSIGGVLVQNIPSNTLKVHLTNARKRAGQPAWAWLILRLEIEVLRREKGWGIKSTS